MTDQQPSTIDFTTSPVGKHAIDAFRAVSIQIAPTLGRELTKEHPVFQDFTNRMVATLAVAMGGLKSKEDWAIALGHVQVQFRALAADHTLAPAVLDEAVSIAAINGDHFQHMAVPLGLPMGALGQGYFYALNNGQVRYASLDVTLGAQRIDVIP